MSSRVSDLNGRVRNRRGIFGLGTVVVAGAAIAACVGNVSGPGGTGGSSTGGPPGSTGNGGGNGMTAPPTGTTVTTPGGTTVTLSATVGRALRRLSVREYDNVVRDLLGDTSQPATKYFGTEGYAEGYDNGAVDLTVGTSSVLDSIQKTAEAVAQTAVTSQMPKLIGTCDPTAGASACVQTFLSTFATKAYRRPLTPAEQSGLQNLYTLGSNPTTGLNGGGFNGGIQLMLEGVLESPSFLYREELGGSPTNHIVTLTPYEVATELSFLLTGSTPDDTLLAAAGGTGGQLLTTQDYVTQATRLLGSPEARPALRAFMHEWMATTQVSATSKDGTVYPSWAPPVGASMASELDQFYDGIMFGTGEQSIHELFSSPMAFVDANLAQVYGVSAPGGSGPQLVMLDAKTRPGILTRAGWLTVHSDSDTSGPVSRGVPVIEGILCQALGTPPAGVPPAPAAAAISMAKMTTRMAFENIHLHGVGGCTGCHEAIDGVGYTFEEFDGLGTYRTSENGLPVDATGTVKLGSDVDGPVNNAAEIAVKISESKQVAGCFTRQVYRYAMGQPDTAAAQPTLTVIQDGDPALNMQPFTATAKMTQAFLALIQEPAFVLRTTVQ